MGFDILFWGILLLINPIYKITDAIAAIICIVALRRGGVYLRDFKKAENFAYALVAVGIIELLFGYIIDVSFPITEAADIWRYGLMIPLFFYIVSGIKDLAMIGENKEIYDMAERVRLPISISIVLTLILLVMTILIPWAYTVLIVSRVAVTAITAMILYVIFRCQKELNTYPGAIPEDDDNT